MLRRAFFLFLLAAIATPLFAQQTCPIRVIGIRARAFEWMDNPNYPGIYADPWSLYLFLWYQNVSSKTVAAVSFQASLGDVLQPPREVPLTFNDYHRLKPGKKRSFDWPDGEYSQGLGKGNYGVITASKIVFSDGTVFTPTDDSCTWSNEPK